MKVRKTKAQLLSGMGPRLVPMDVGAAMIGKSRTWIWENRDEFRTVMIGRQRLVEVDSLNEYVDRQLAAAGHVPANTDAAHAPALPADLIANAEAVAASRAPARAVALARQVLALAGRETSEPAQADQAA